MPHQPLSTPPSLRSFPFSPARHLLLTHLSPRLNLTASASYAPYPQLCWPIPVTPFTGRLPQHCPLTHTTPPRLSANLLQGRSSLTESSQSQHHNNTTATSLVLTLSRAQAVVTIILTVYSSRLFFLHSCHFVFVAVIFSPHPHELRC